LVRDGSGLLLGTASGVYSVADPAQVQHWALPNTPGMELWAGGEGDADFITAAGVMQVRGNEMVPGATAWPERQGALVRDAVLHFGEASASLPTRYVAGLAVNAGVAVAGLSRELVLLARTGVTVRTPLEGVLGAVATDGRNFLVATMTRGVHVVTPDGALLDRIGQGRANLSEIRPGKVVLLFWDGLILDSDANRLGRVPFGNPRDATLVQGRLAVLVTRSDRAPVVGLLTQDEWRPLDVPGLAEIGAEQIAATKQYLFVAGPRGVLRVRLPVEFSAPPRADWRWTAPLAAGEVRLQDAGQETVRLSFAPGNLAPAPDTSLRVRVGEGSWSEFRPGQAQTLTLPSGRTAVALQAERNGLVTEAGFTVVRPQPWWLRPWAWLLHAAGLGLLVFGLARLRTRQLERRTRELQARVEERTAELRKANAVKEEFLASISHEIRNPLNGVVGICEMLAEREVGPRERMLVRTLGGCADQLEESARVMDPDLAACSLLLPEQPCWLHGDSGKLRQILCNLISNALKYGHPREAGIEVGAGAAEGGRVRVRLAVRNTGETIPADELPRLFESFRRGGRTAGVAGSGLGLAVCRRLATAMGGHLTAASAEGVTEFAFEAVLPSAQPPVPSGSAPATVSRALAIEDEDYNRIVLGHALRALGYSVDWAEDAAAALRLAPTQPYDLILTDWRLPDMEGGELCTRLLALLPNPKPPIIAVTAYANAEKLAEAKAVGMAGFITKPITREKLERIILGLSGNRQPRRSLDAEISLPAVPRSVLASLGELAPSPLRLAGEIAERWRGIAALAAMQDPRTARDAHALRSLLLLVGERGAAEQLGVFEQAADAGDWAAVQRLAPHVGAEITAGQSRLRS
jgi:signal transduction histidine kinase/CheY-like chemotaxis protein